MSKKIIKEKHKYLVIKCEDLDKFFHQFTKGIFTTAGELKHINHIPFNRALEEIRLMRKAEGKRDNKYIVCNEDEPYAGKVWNVILEGERKKLVDHGA